MINRRILGFLAGVLIIATSEASAFEPVVTDSRIKTLVYNENDVYSLTTHYGYQSNIEFSPKETIETISLGDRVAWQVVPAGRRLFIRPLEENTRTNMTVITSKRSYQFDLASGSGNALPGAELAYVVRFYYPEEDRSAPPPSALPPVSAQQLNQAAAIARPSLESLNFRYTFTGPDALAPLKVFDDGRSTYLQVRQRPAISMVNPNGEEVPVNPTMTTDGFLKIPALSGKFTLRYGNDVICVYNEAM